MQTITDATKITENVNPQPIKESLNALRQGLTGTNVDTITAIISAGNDLFSTIEKQRGQVTSFLGLSDEYIKALDNFGDGLKELVAKVAILEQTFVIYGERAAVAIKGLGDVINQTEPLGTFYYNHRDLFIEKVRNWTEKARMWAVRSGMIVRAMRLMRNKIERVLDAQNAPPELLATDLCMPIPGTPC
jgi:hypothetical protein